jgi:hypothetical protein
VDRLGNQYARRNSVNFGLGQLGNRSFRIKCSPARTSFGNQALNLPIFAAYPRHIHCDLGCDLQFLRIVVSSVLVTNRHRAGWLRGTAFDSTYILGIASLAVASGWVVVSNPALFTTVFVLNAWLLGYHHVISTFTRLTFDKDSFKERRFLVTWLPVLVLAAVVLACIAVGAWLLTTVYLYWQWWHYTRQSYGISRIYQRRSGVNNDLLQKLVIYALPVWGILHRSAQAPDQFLFTEVRVVPVPLWLVAIAGSFTLVVLVWWMAQTVREWFIGSISIAHTLYLCSHLVIFGVGYLATENINHGWLVLTIWHNCQYILTVWMFNNNRFKDTVDRKHWFLSFISQRSKVATYLAVCLLLSTVIYAALQYSLTWVAAATATSLPLFAIAFQAINFHHYVVDAVIWKVRRKPIQQNLGIPTV